MRYANLKKNNFFFGVVFSVLFSFCVRTSASELALFDADIHPPTKLRHFTQPWTKGSDIVPTAVAVDKDGGKMIEITYAGGNGMGTTMLDLTPDEVNSLQNINAAGIKLLIDYEQEDFSKLNVISFFTDKSSLTTKITLEKGLKEYSVKSGWRKAETPLRWSLLKKIYIESSSPDLKWRLKKVEIIEEKSDRNVALEFDKPRKTHEILPTISKICMDGKCDEWSAVKPLPNYYSFRDGTELTLSDTPFKVKLCYDDENLYVFSSSAFPTAPRALKTKADDNIWEDEAIELFFSSELDNSRFIQFVINQRGTVFDYIREFDEVIQMIRTKREWNMKHKKASTYENGLWNTEMAFPLSELKFDREKNNLLAFQVAQDYAERPEKHLKTVSWTLSRLLPSPLSFGILVFNRKPFGDGDVSVESIERNGSNGTDVTITCSLDNFAPGEYSAVITVVAPDKTTTISEQLKLAENKETRKFTVRDGIKNRDSCNTCYVSIRNSVGDSRITATNFHNKVVQADLFGKKLFFPEPKHIKWNSGTFFAGDATMLCLEENATPRTMRTAEIFADKYYGYTGKKLAIKKGAPGDGAVIFRIAKTALFDGKEEALKKEGYLLSVSKDHITLIGGDEPGLYYAGTTFFQLLRNSMKIQDRHPVDCVDILDWPDIPRRSLLFNGQWQFRGGKICEHTTGDELIDWVDRYVAGTKLNMLLVNVWGSTQFKRRPEFNNNPHKTFTLDDIARLAQYCRDNFIEPVPVFPVGSHCDGWLLSVHPELREKGFSVQADVTHPDHDAIVYDCFQDVIDAMRPKYFSPTGDEWWQNGKPGEKAETLLGGKPRNLAFLDWHVKLNNWLKPKGIQMILFHDMLTPFHNGKVFDTYKIADKLPKDIIIVSWADPSYTKQAFFYDRGFTLWINATGSALWDTERKKIDSYGLGLYDGWYGTRPLLDRGYARAGRTVTYPRILRLSDWAWNFRTEKPDSVDDWVAMGKTAAGIQLLAVTPNPVAGEKIECIDISKHTNTSINEYAAANKVFPQGGSVAVPAGVLDVGNIPMKLSGGGKNDCVSVKTGGAGTSIEVGKPYASLIFLHTLHYTDEFVKKISSVQSYRAWQRGFPAGRYVVKYADGSSITIPLRLDRNIGLNDDVANAMNPHDCRCLLRLKNSDGEPLNLHQYEWKNPKPEIAITSVDFERDDFFDFNVFLFALSGRTVADKR